MGRQAGIRGDRTGLLWRLIELVQAHRPGWLVLENVPRIAAYADEILGTLADLDYDTETRVLCPTWFGLRQRRPRWFCVAYDYRREREVARKWTILHREITPASFGRDQPIPHRNRVPVRLSDSVDRCKRIGALANSVSPVLAEWIASGIKQQLNEQ